MSVSTPAHRQLSEEEGMMCWVRIGGGMMVACMFVCADVSLVPSQKRARRRGRALVVHARLLDAETELSILQPLRKACPCSSGRGVHAMTCAGADSRRRVSLGQRRAGRGDPNARSWLACGGPNPCVLYIDACETTSFATRLLATPLAIEELQDPACRVRHRSSPSDAFPHSHTATRRF